MKGNLTQETQQGGLGRDSRAPLLSRRHVNSCECGQSAVADRNALRRSAGQSPGDCRRQWSPARTSRAVEGRTTGHVITPA